MLRDRTERGDNEAPAIAIARLWQQLAAKRLAGIDAPTIEAIRRAIKQHADARGRHFYKDGSLNSDPLTEVRAGCYETAAGPVIYVAMTQQPTPGADGREASSQRLGRTVDALRGSLLDAVAR